MATGATIYRADLSIADIDRSYYANHALTVARHPSETEERLMVRLLAFALYADEELVSGRGLSSDDEPDLWRRDPTGLIDLWLSVGLPDAKWLRKAASRSRRVVLIAYGSRVDAWWSRSAPDLVRFDHLTVLSLQPAQTAELARLAARSMRFDVSIQDGNAWFGSPAGTADVGWQILKGESGQR